jgi:NAD(P)-dependent dehydrogenase (short-subunit alcohol dehydrogenase family)
MSGTLLLTGANRGIGLEFVRQYDADGWRIHATCRSPENAHELSALAAASSGRISLHPLDVTQPAQIEMLAAVLADEPIDILLNNAGVYGPEGARFGQLDPQGWLDTLAVNTIAPIKLMEALIDRVAASDRRIVASISSKMGSIADNGSGGSYIYRSSKAALNAAMKSASIDLAPRGVICVILHPGWVQTDMGGPDAEITVGESVTGMRAILDRVTAADIGSFFDIDGSVIPW